MQQRITVMTATSLSCSVTKGNYDPVKLKLLNRLSSIKTATGLSGQMVNLPCIYLRLASKTYTDFDNCSKNAELCKDMLFPIIPKTSNFDPNLDSYSFEMGILTSKQPFIIIRAHKSCIAP